MTPTTTVSGPASGRVVPVDSSGSAETGPTYTRAVDAVVAPGLHRLTVDEFERMVALLDLDRVELIDGMVFDVSPEGSAHAVAVTTVLHQLEARYPDKQVLPTGSVELDDDSLWDPDVYVVDAPPDKIFSRYPGAADLLLVVEVSLTTLGRDTRRKVPVYARSGVPECWVLHQIDGVWQRTCYRRPDRDGYRFTETIALPDGLGSLPAQDPSG